MPRKKGLEEAEIQKLHTTAPENLTDEAQNCQSVRVLTSGRHGDPQVFGHSIRNQGNHGAPPVGTKSI